ncbi:hypothetical protein A4U53_004310 (plasmid) [Rhizobium ruizarguesonis]|uniref:Uncharacterized protein n=1 Tax=Rhizobium ruizarguesonis TaxID=2081791 RepID=A0ACD5EGW2_9HYPH
MTTIGVVFVRHGTRIKLIAILFAYRRTVQKLFMHQSRSDHIVAHCGDAWNKLVAQPWKIMSIGMRDWAHRF